MGRAGGAEGRRRARSCHQPLPTPDGGDLIRKPDFTNVFSVSLILMAVDSVHFGDDDVEDSAPLTSQMVGKLSVNAPADASATPDMASPTDDSREKNHFDFASDHHNDQ